MKEDFSEGQEKDMLDYLYTLQYHCRGILALSLGNHVLSASSNARKVDVATNTIRDTDPFLFLSQAP